MKMIDGLARRIFLRVEQPFSYQLFLSLSWLRGLGPFACLPSMQSSLPVLNLRLLNPTPLPINAMLRHWAHLLRPLG